MEEFQDVQLRTQADYLAVLAKIAPRAAFVQIVQICEGEPEGALAWAKAHLELTGEKCVNNWPGTCRGGRGAAQYTFATNAAFWKYLRQIPGFFFNRQDEWGCDRVEETEFGQDDIAFLDKGRALLFFTTTHEGLAAMRKGL